MLKLAIVFTLAASAASALTGVVSHVRDGDTIEVEGVPVRLSGVTCDERGTPLGEEATDLVTELLGRRTVLVRLDGSRTHDRFAGKIGYSDPGSTLVEDLGEVLIADGVCGRCPAFDPAGDYLPAQLKAGAFNGKMPTYCED